MAKKTFECEFGPGDHVVIDGDYSIDGEVLAVAFNYDYVEVLVSWFAAGDAKKDWFHVRRVAARGKG